MNTTTETTTGLMRAFDFQEQAVRTLLRDGDPWFVAADVCRVLEISNARDAVKSLDNDEKITVGNADGNPRNGVPHQFTLISESGLYALIFKSRKPEAKKFRRWVTGEVLPALRKQGAYSLAQAAARDAAAERLEGVRGEVVSKLREIDGMAAYAAQAGCLGRRLSMDRVRGLHTVGRLRLDALRLLWDLESGGQRAALSADGTQVVAAEDEDEAAVAA